MRLTNVGEDAGEYHLLLAGGLEGCHEVGVVVGVNLTCTRYHRGIWDELEKLWDEWSVGTWK